MTDGTQKDTKAVVIQHRADEHTMYGMLGQDIYCAKYTESM